MLQASKRAAVLIAIGSIMPATQHAMAGSGSLSIEADVGSLVGARPQWLGSGRYEFFAAPLLSLKRLHIPGIVSIGGSELGFSLAPSLGTVAGRGPGTDTRLRGLASVSDAYELGLKASYTWPAARVFAEVRQGFGGHSAVVGGVGADAIIQLGDRTKLEIGPRLDFAAGDYMETYFSVSPTEAISSGLSVHEASAGIVSMGVAAMLRHELTEDWAAVTRLEYDRLVGGAADAPFVAAAGRHQWLIGVGLTYHLEWDGAGTEPY